MYTLRTTAALQGDAAAAVEQLVLRPLGDRGEAIIAGRSLITFDEPISRARFSKFLAEVQARVLPFDPIAQSRIYLSRYGVARVPVPPDIIDVPLQFKYGILSVSPERTTQIVPVPLPERGLSMDPLAEMKVRTSSFTGAGVRVAIIDTGLERDHPDFRGRPIERDSKVYGLDSFDGHGHGTHCTGLICGPRNPAADHPGYGVAPGIDLIVIRGLDDTMLGDDGDILQAMGRAEELNADIIVLCMSANVAPVPEFETEAAGMLRNNRLVIAAAGNDSSANVVSPVGHPANAPSIVAVAAINDAGRPWPFSCGTVTRGDAVDICAPGEGVLSSSLSTIRLHDRFSGTSQAAAYVAGVAALWAHSDSNLRGTALRDKLLDEALDLGARDLVGAGLVQAPQ